MHPVLTREHFEQAAYARVMFDLNFAGAAVAAVGIMRA